MGNRPTHFEIPVDDPDRAEKFYSSVFGWTVQRYAGAPTYYGLAGTGDMQPGIDGALMQRGEGASGTRITMSVESIEDAAAKIEAEGGKVLQGKMPFLAWATSPSARTPKATRSASSQRIRPRRCRRLPPPGPAWPWPSPIDGGGRNPVSPVSGGSQSA